MAGKFIESILILNYLMILLKIENLWKFYSGKSPCFFIQMSSGVRRKNFQGVKGYGRPSRGPGGGAPLRRGIFENLQKNFLRKLQKCIILAYFQKILKTLR